MRPLPPAFCVVAFVLVFFAPAYALKREPNELETLGEWEALLQYDLGAPVATHNDTIYFGGGTGTGSVVRGGVWNWETANPNETAEFFLDGDPVGNQYRDGWKFDDRTARNGPSANGAGHWRTNGTYDFNFDGGAFAHRATTHTNTAGNFGPDPLIGGWSLWIGTNLYLNPENCAWGQNAGYGDGWSQGFRKTFPVPAGSLGIDYDIQFFHRYAVETGFDTNKVEASWDGVIWFFVNRDGIFNGGDEAGPLPLPAGEQTIATLPTVPFNEAGNLHVRFRLVADAFFSDNNEGGNFFYAWQIDNVQLLRNGSPEGPLATFEAGMDGWEPVSFEGWDFDTTGELNRPAGRLELITNVACPPLVQCPETCTLSNRVLMFTDKDDCDLNDRFQDSYITSRAFAIGGASNPDIDGDAGRLVEADLYRDGGAGVFDTGPAICYIYWPYNASLCPYTPAAGNPGFGSTFNWSQTDFATCDFFGQPTGTTCNDNFVDNISNAVPGDADSVILHIGAFSQCRSAADCDINDNGTPFYDNIRFGVFNPAGLSLAAGRYCDSFPTTNGNLNTVISRSDGSHSFPNNLGVEFPLRHVRADTVEVQSGAPGASVHLRWRVNLGPCPASMQGHPFFSDFEPGTWHSARMDTGRFQGTGINAPGNYMTCFHEDDPFDGTFWDGQPPAVEPCDDILPDGAFKAGARIDYFFEVRDVNTGELLGTTPAARNGAPVKTTENYAPFWLEWEVLPEPDPACDGTNYAHNLLVVDRAPNVEHERRLSAVLNTLGLEFDIYNQFGGIYNGIGRREDRVGQQPRPPIGGATQAQLEQYDCIWWYARTAGVSTMSDRTTSAVPPPVGGQPSKDQQSLETWIENCQPGLNRLLVLEGFGWASDVDINTNHGSAFLSRFGVDVLADDYAQDLAANDLRRCARIKRTLPNAPVPPQFDTGELIFSGCPDNVPQNVIGAVAGGQGVANFVESMEGGGDPVNCADDVNRPAWHAIVRKADAGEPCERSVLMSAALTYLYPLNCVDECLFDDWVLNGEDAELVIEMFNWAGKDIADNPIGVPDPPGAPRLVNALYQAQPNPANPSARIRYTIAEKGQVALKIFDVGGRLVRTLVDQVQEPAEAGFEVVWDGMNDGGQRVGSGVFFYQIEAPGWSSAKKLVILK